MISAPRTSRKHGSRNVLKKSAIRNMTTYNCDNGQTINTSRRLSKDFIVVTHSKWYSGPEQVLLLTDMCLPRCGCSDKKFPYSIAFRLQREGGTGAQ